MKLFLLSPLVLSLCSGGCPDPQSPLNNANMDQAVIAFSGNNGETWELIEVPGKVSTGNMSSFNNGSSLLTTVSDANGLEEILRSTNFGDNWSIVREIHDIYAMSPTGEQNSGIIIGSNGLIKFTSNDCTDLSLITSGTIDNLLDLAFNTSSGTGIIVGAGNILRSSDGGRSWSIPSGAPDQNGRGFNQVEYTVDGFFEIYTESSNSTIDSIFKSSDGGVNWYSNPVLIPPELVGNHKRAGIMASRSYVTSIMSADFRTSAEHYSSILIRTLDGGYTWKAMSTGTELPITALEFVANAVIASTYEGKILRSTDIGNSWQTIDLKGKYLFQDIFESSPGHIYMSGYKYVNAAQ